MDTSSIPVKSFPFVEEEIRSLASKVATPFYLYDEATIRKTCREFNQAFSWAPSFKNFFAVKATPNPVIVNIVKEEGNGADCSSMAELLVAEAVGFKGEDIMFTSNNTPLAAYKKAIQLGAIINFDDISHIDFVKEKIGLPEFVCFRYNPGPKRTGSVIIGNPSEAKFGVTEDQLFNCYVQSRDCGATRFALHTMIASNCLNENELVETGRMVFELVAELKSKHGIALEMVDLGGGIGVPYKPGDSKINLKSLGEKIEQLYNQIIRPAGLHPLAIRYECGRLITAASGVLVTRVVHQKDTYKKYIGVDASISDLMRPALYGAYHHIRVIRDDEPAQLKLLPSKRSIFQKEDSLGGKLMTFDVVGSLCENNDKLAIDRLLPSDIRIGDLLVIHDTGAHGHSMGYNYNGRLRSAEYLKKDKNNKQCWMKCREVHANIIQCRNAESHSDLFSTIVWTGSLPGRRWFDVISGRIGLIVGLAIGIVALKWMRQKGVANIF